MVKQLEDATMVNKALEQLLEKAKKDQNAVTDVLKELKEGIEEQHEKEKEIAALIGAVSAHVGRIARQLPAPKETIPIEEGLRADVHSPPSSRSPPPEDKQVEETETPKDGGLQIEGPPSSLDQLPTIES